MLDRARLVAQQRPADTAYDWTTEDQISNARRITAQRQATPAAARCEHAVHVQAAIAGLILGPALLIGSFAWSGYPTLSTIFDENRSTVAKSSSTTRR